MNDGSKRTDMYHKEEMRQHLKKLRHRPALKLSNIADPDTLQGNQSGKISTYNWSAYDGLLPVSRRMTRFYIIKTYQMITLFYAALCCYLYCNMYLNGEGALCEYVMCTIMSAIQMVYVFVDIAYRINRTQKFVISFVMTYVCALVMMFCPTQPSDIINFYVKVIMSCFLFFFSVELFHMHFFWDEENDSNIKRKKKIIVKICEEAILDYEKSCRSKSNKQAIEDSFFYKFKQMGICIQKCIHSFNIKQKKKIIVKQCEEAILDYEKSCMPKSNKQVIEDSFYYKFKPMGICIQECIHSFNIKRKKKIIVKQCEEAILDYENSCMPKSNKQAIEDSFYYKYKPMGICIQEYIQMMVRFLKYQVYGTSKENLYTHCNGHILGRPENVQFPIIKIETEPDNLPNLMPDPYLMESESDSDEILHIESDSDEILYTESDSDEILHTESDSDEILDPESDSDESLSDYDGSDKIADEYYIQGSLVKLQADINPSPLPLNNSDVKSGYLDKLQAGYGIHINNIRSVQQNMGNSDVLNLSKIGPTLPEEADSRSPEDIRYERSTQTEWDSIPVESTSSYEQTIEGEETDYIIPIEVELQDIKSQAKSISDNLVADIIDDLTTDNIAYLERL